MNTIEIWSAKSNLVRLAVICCVVFVPFLLAGAAIGLALSRFASNVNRLYSVDLLGSALGGALSVWLVAHLGSGETALFAGALGVAAGAVFALGADRGTRRIAVPAAVVAGVLIVGLAMSLIRFPIPVAPGKELAAPDMADGLVRLFSATAEVEVAPEKRVFPMVGGDFGALDGRLVNGRLVGQDGTAPTLLIENAATLDAFPFLDDSQTSSGYVARGADTAEPPSVLVIGVGGGIDVMIALKHGARHVTAVEINRAMIDMVTTRFGDYLGGLFDPAGRLGDRVDLHHADGRSYVRSSPDRFDLIQMSGVDSFTALSSGAYTLSEAYLYTVEAVKDLYERLEPNGFLNISRFAFVRPRKPRETLRLANIAYTALSELGVEDPASQIAVFQGLHWASTMVKRGKITPEETRALQAFAEREGFLGLVFDPLHDPGAPFPTSPRQLHAVAERVAKALSASPVPAAPGLPAPDALAAELTGVARDELAGESGSAVRLERLVAGVPVDARDPVRAALSALVDGVVRTTRQDDVPFHETQLDFQHVLRASPAERRAFIGDYEYDLSPSRDDTPFFFDYYRYSGLLGGWRAGNPLLLLLDKYHPDYPVGHAVLLASQLQVTVLAALLIMLPLPFLSRRSTPIQGRWKVFGYFAALGAGFMALEMVLMQKLILFLGHPTYAASVVLSSLLASAGLGSMLSGRLGLIRPRTLGVLALAIAAMVGVTAAVITAVFPGLTGWSLEARIAAAVAVLVPLGLVLGMPFPLGIRAVHARAPELVPWAWGINAFLSVFASLFTITVSMAFGFSTVFVGAAAIYLGGFLAMASYLGGSAGGVAGRVGTSPMPLSVHRRRRPALLGAAVALLLSLRSPCDRAATGSFVDFESGRVRPLAPSPDRRCSSRSTLPATDCRSSPSRRAGAPARGAEFPWLDPLQSPCAGTARRPLLWW